MQRALALWNGDPEAEAVLGRVALRLDDRVRAEAILREALAIRSQSAPLWAALAQLRLDAGDQEGARAAAFRALAIDRGNKQAADVLVKAGGTLAP